MPNYRPLTMFGLLFLTVCITSTQFLGCTGEDGLNGFDAPDFDHVPPEVYITDPPPNQRVYLDTLRFVAEATDEDGMIDSVKFHIGNFDPDLTTVTTPPYEYLMDMTQLDPFSGLLDVYATAYDTAGNFQNSPLFFIDYRKLIGRDTLSHLSMQGGLGTVRLPADTSRVLEDETVQEFLVTQYSTRFKALADCDLIGVEYYLVHRDVDPEITTYSEFKSYIMGSNSSGEPGALIDSIIFTPDPFDLDRWLFLDYSVNSTTSFTAGEEFHVGISTDAELTATNNDTGIVIQSTYREFENLVPDSANSYWFASDSGWRNITVADTSSFTTELWIRAIVDYGAGSSQR